MIRSEHGGYLRGHFFAVLRIHTGAGKGRSLETTDSCRGNGGVKTESMAGANRSWSYTRFDTMSVLMYIYRTRDIFCPVVNA